LIRKPNKQLFNKISLLPALLLLILLGLFYFAAFYDNSFFYYIACAQVAGVWILVSFRNRLRNGQADLNLQRQGFLEKANLLSADISKEQHAIQSIKEKIQNYAKLKNLTEKLCMCFTVQQASHILSNEVDQLFAGEDKTVILFLFHSKTGKLGLSFSQKGQMEVSIKSKKGDLYDRWVIRNLKPLLVKDTRSDFRFDAERMDDEKTRPFRSLMSVPMIIEDKAIGILRLDSVQEHYFSTEDVRLLTAISDLGAVAIENAQLYERIEDLAIRDSLTGLYLRRFLMDRFSHEIKRELRRKGELSFMMIDLDHFKNYNDKYGHMAGDIVLKSIGLMLMEMFDAPGNIVCRYGGEEFAVLLPDCSKQEAVVLAEKLRKKMETQIFVLRRQKTRITVSVGVASFPKDAQLREELIQQADKALYEAKKSGRNRVCVA